MITQARLKELLHYDPETGVFTWLRPTSNRVKRGAVAGYETDKGYKQIGLDRGLYLAHRLVWLYVHGCLPENHIDHIDQDQQNNRITNLRDVSNQDNCKNQKKRPTNKSGITGVRWNKDCKKWQANITINGKQTHLGLFDSIEGAASARKRADVKHGYHTNHGNAG
jgi:hypothetical protein